MPANDSWIYQGRDEKGRFGDGTSPGSGDADAGRSPGGGVNGMLPQTQVIYGAVGHLSPAERHQYSPQLEHGGLSRLAGSLAAWSRVSGLDRDTFRERFLGGIGSDDAVDHLRNAAAGASKATSPQQQRDAAAELADAWRLIGADRWARFITGAYQRAGADDTASAGRVLLAQATTSNTATDAGSNASATSATVAGHYIADDPQRWIGQNAVGTGECVDLVRTATGAPRSTEWQRGAQVQGNANIRPGTAIATFDSNGRYDGHAAIYLGQDAQGIRVIDQWNRRQGGRIVGQVRPGERTLPLGDPRHAHIDRGEYYYVVE